MAFLNKIFKKRKKEEDLSFLDKEPDFSKPNDPLGGGSMPGYGDKMHEEVINDIDMHPPSAQKPSMQQPSFNLNQPQNFGNRDMEVVSAKLDAIRAQLESLNSRVANIERIARGEHEKW